MKYTTFDVMKALNISRERLKDWMDKKFAVPSIPAEGKGTKALFTLQDIYATGLFQTLVRGGYKRKKAAGHVAQNYRNVDPNEIENIDYLGIRYEVVEGEEKILTVGLDDRAAETIPEGAWKFNFKKGDFESPKHPGVPHPPSREPKDVDWELVVIINMERIRNRVKDALGVEG